MRSISVLVIIATLLCGCAGDPVGPAMQATDGSMQASFTQATDPHEGPFRLWGEWQIFIDETRTKVDAVPLRSGRMHLNVPKFLEQYCTDCLQITNITNNGDGTIDLTVRITHPFTGHPEYTGFDVKGIIMFNGSHTVHWHSLEIYPYGEESNHNYFYISWAELGDAEVLNRDGYTVRWSPWWDSGSSLPILSYWHGKYTIGTPTANINAYKNFYTDEERHMFRDDGSVSREYHIYLPPGPIAAGYAVEACWEPPLVTPVTDPLNDFPITANQEEPYYFRFVVNDGEPVTEEVLTFEYEGDCSYARFEWSQWYGDPPHQAAQSWPYYPDWVVRNQSAFEP